MNRPRLIGRGILLILLLVLHVALAAAEDVTAEQITDLYNKALDKRDDLARRLAQQAQDTNNLNAADAGAGLKEVDGTVGEGGNSGRPLPPDVRKAAEKTQTGTAGAFLSKNKTSLGIGAGVLLGVLIIFLLRRRRKGTKEVVEEEEKLLAQLSEDEKKLYQLFKNKKNLVERNTTELYRLFGEEKQATQAETTSATNQIK
ncbi:hypothetical protein HY772_01750 [Candidatus Woesearchaeota archaeon]|nr:hypothetical protein [Candidatus Woesearchaeota archaeon]